MATAARSGSEAAVAAAPSATTTMTPRPWETMSWISRAIRERSWRSACSWRSAASRSRYSVLRARAARWARRVRFRTPAVQAHRTATTQSAGRLRRLYPIRSTGMKAAMTQAMTSAAQGREIADRLAAARWWTSSASRRSAGRTLDPGPIGSWAPARRTATAKATVGEWCRRSQHSPSPALTVSSSHSCAVEAVVTGRTSWL